MPTFSVDPNPNVTYKLWHEDEHLLIVGKPARLVTTPGLKHDRSSLLNGLFVKYGTRLQKIGRDRDFGLLHRLDRMTSGLVIIALTRDAYDDLRKQFETREVAKFYWAIVGEKPEPAEGLIKAKIAEYQGYPGVRTRAEGREIAATKKAPLKLARVSSKGEEAKTAYRVLETSPKATMVECRAFTGRLHQVRVHMAHIGCPILGDGYYAPASVADASPRLALHAHRVVIKHPTTGETLDIRSTWPEDLKGLLKTMKLKKPEVV